MLKRDTRARFVRTGLFAQKYQLWTPSAGHTRTTFPVAKYEELIAQQMSTPVAIMRVDSERRQWWMFHNDIFWEDEGLTPTEVEALLLDRERKRQRRVERAIAAVQQQNGKRATAGSRQPIPDDVKMFVWQRDNGNCVKCGSQSNLEFDHIIPVAMGGSNTARNIQLLCETCNRSKGASLG